MAKKEKEKRKSHFSLLFEVEFGFLPPASTTKGDKHRKSASEKVAFREF